MITSAEHFNRAMTLWFDLTGLDPNAESFTMDKWELRSMSDELKESMGYDPSFVTTYLLLDAFSTSYFKDAKVSVHEFDEDPDKVFDYMDKVREFKKLIRSPEITEVADAFFEQVRKALLNYGIESDRIAKFLDDRANLAIIRRDALKSINRLRADHFLQGETDPAEVLPLYNREVFGYWNINSLIEHACSMPAGIALNLIRDPDELHSYFSFSVRNGGNLIMLTDVPEYAHPLGRYMSRRPDRAFDARASQNWFPYQLLSIKYDEKGNPYHDKYREAQAQNLIPRQPNHFVVSKLVDLDIAQIVWTTLMFDLIVEKYWRKPIPVKELSYTNEMIRLADQNVLLARAAQSNLPVTGYQPLQLPILTPKDVMTDALDEKAIGKKHDGWKDRYGANRWMEERYGERVPVEALNQIGTNDGSVLFLPGETQTELRKRWPSHDGAIVPVEGEIKKATPGQYRSSFKGAFDEFEGRAYALERVDGTLFGTREQIEADRKFIARVNFTAGIQREADTEFEAERPKALKWFKEGIEANLERLIAYAHYDEVEHARTRFATFGGTWLDGDNADQRDERYNFTKMWDLNEKRESWMDYPPTGMLRFGRFDDRGRSHCYYTDARASWQLNITPGSPQDLCYMTGTKFEDLPVYLQHWNPGDDHYLGNHILDRIDPLEWKLDSPWDQVSFTVSIYLSKRGRARVLKELPKPAIEDVSHIKHRGITQQNGRSRRSEIQHSDWRIDEYTKERDKK